MSKKQMYTSEGLKKLQEELLYLKTTRRDEIKNDIAVARSFGDLSENSEYDEARNEQAKNEARIKELEELIQHAEVVDDSKQDTKTVGLGSTVEVERNGTVIAYKIVGSNEADPFDNKISDVSPVGKGLIGAKQGDVVEVEVPSGVISMKVIDVYKA